MAVFLIGLMLFYSPLISLFEGTRTLAGVPLLHFYLFGAWALVIVAAVWSVGREKE